MNDMNTVNTTDTNTAPSEKKTMNLVVPIILVLGLVAIAYFMLRPQATSDTPMTSEGSSQQNEMESTTTSGDTVVAPGTAVDTSSGDTTMVDDVKIIEVEAGSFYYKPNEIRVKKGDTVRIVMTSVDMMHDFNIDALNISIPITNNGETKTVEFVADTVGEFEYYCSVGQHRQMGQVGTLIVEE